LDRIDFHQHDLSDSRPDGTFDLASAQFLHSTVRIERTQMLRNAAGAVVPGGLLVIVDHDAHPELYLPRGQLNAQACLASPRRVRRLGRMLRAAELLAACC
jgi:chemotaxis methyl-accepting protein methylase